MTPHDCPASHELASLLRGQLNAADESRLTSHLDQCATCRETLEKLAGDVEFQQAAAQQLRDAPHLPAPQRMAQWIADADEWLRAETKAQPTTAGWAATAVPTGFPAPGVTLGRYELLRELGRGGMGVVFLARDSMLDRRVAIKVLGPQWVGDSTARQRFMAEARSAAAVSSRHVVTIHSVEELQGWPLLVMEYIPGPNLQQLLDAQGPLPVSTVVPIALRVAAGLAAAHARGLIHRDVKPGNVLIVPQTGMVKLTDFGLARAADGQQLTKAGVLVGTPAYMAPEQLEGKPFDQRADLYALGSVLFAMLAGRPPVNAEGTMALARRVVEGDLDRLSDLRSDVPPLLTSLVDRLLQRRPDDRIATANEVSEVLRQLRDELSGAEANWGADSPAAPTVATQAPVTPAAPRQPAFEPTRAESTRLEPGRSKPVRPAREPESLPPPPPPPPLPTGVPAPPPIVPTSAELTPIEPEREAAAVAFTVSVPRGANRALGRGRAARRSRQPWWLLVASSGALLLVVGVGFAAWLSSHDSNVADGGSGAPAVAGTTFPEPSSRRPEDSFAGSASVGAVAQLPGGLFSGAAGLSENYFEIPNPGGPPRRFLGLLDAITAAPPDTTILVRGSGLTISGPIRVFGKALRVQAVDGSRPVIQLRRPPGERSFGWQTDSPLSLEGLTLVATNADDSGNSDAKGKGVPRFMGPAEALLANLGARLEIIDCRIGISDGSAAVWLDNGAALMARRSQFHGGDGTAIVWRDLQPANRSASRVRLEQCHVTGQTGVWVDMRPEAACGIEFVESTVIVQQALRIEMPTARLPDAMSQPRMRVDALNSWFDASQFVVFWTHSMEDLPQQRDAAARRLPERWLWHGVGNRYARGMEFLLALPSFRAPGPQRAIIVRDLAAWREFWRNDEQESREVKIAYGRDRSSRREALTPPTLPPQAPDSVRVVRDAGLVDPDRLRVVESPTN